MKKFPPITTGALTALLIVVIFVAMSSCAVPVMPVVPGSSSLESSANVYTVGSVGVGNAGGVLFAVVDPKTGATCYTNYQVSTIFCLPKP